MTSVPGPPGLLDVLKDDLTFPLAWGTSPVRDPARWRRTARAAVEDALLVPAEPCLPYDPEYTPGPEGDGYTRESVTVTLTRRTRARTVGRAWDAGERLRLKVWPEHGHTFASPRQDETYAWLDSVLRV